MNNHYQKIDKYRQKYQRNIFVGNFSKDFIDGHTPSVNTKGITVRKKLNKKNDDLLFFTDGIKSVSNSVGKC